MPIGRRSSVTAFVLDPRRDGKWQEVSVERLGGFAKGPVDGAGSIVVSWAKVDHGVELQPIGTVVLRGIQVDAGLPITNQGARSRR